MLSLPALMQAHSTPAQIQRKLAGTYDALFFIRTEFKERSLLNNMGLSTW